MSECRHTVSSRSLVTPCSAVRKSGSARDRVLRRTSAIGFRQNEIPVTDYGFAIVMTDSMLFHRDAAEHLGRDICAEVQIQCIQPVPQIAPARDPGETVELDAGARVGIEFCK